MFICDTFRILSSMASLAVPDLRELPATVFISPGDYIYLEGQSAHAYCIICLKIDERGTELILHYLFHEVLK